LPNFVLLDSSLPDVARLVAAMLEAREAVESRSWSHPTGADDRGLVGWRARRSSRRAGESDLTVKQAFYRPLMSRTKTSLWRAANANGKWKAAYERAELLAAHGSTCPMPSLLQHLAAPGCPRLGSY